MEGARKTRELLESFTAKDIVAPKVITMLSPATTVLDGYKKLSEAKIWSAPLFNGEHYLGFIGFADLSLYLLGMFEKAKERRLSRGRPTEKVEMEDKEVDPAKEKEMIDATLIQDVYGRSGRDLHQGWFPLTEDVTLWEVCKTLCKVKRVPIMRDGDVVNIISQSSIVKFLAQPKEKLARMKALASKTVGELKLGNSNVIALRFGDGTIDAVKVMHERSVSGIPLVNDQGRVISAISLSDLKPISSAKGNTLAHLLQPVGQYMNMIRQDPEHAADDVRATVMTIQEKEEFGTMIGKFAATRVHRMFVVDAVSGHPKRVISLTDVVKCLVKEE